MCAPSLPSVPSEISTLLMSLIFHTFKEDRTTHRPPPNSLSFPPLEKCKAIMPNSIHFPKTHSFPHPRKHAVTEPNIDKISGGHVKIRYNCGSFNSDLQGSPHSCHLFTPNAKSLKVKWLHSPVIACVLTRT